MLACFAALNLTWEEHDVSKRNRNRRQVDAVMPVLAGHVALSWFRQARIGFSLRFLDARSTPEEEDRHFWGFVAFENGSQHLVAVVPYHGTSSGSATLVLCVERSARSMALPCVSRICYVFSDSAWSFCILCRGSVATTSITCLARVVSADFVVAVVC